METIPQNDLNPKLVPQPQQTLLEMQAIQKVFLTDEVETHALSDVHLKVQKGEWLAIIGPSGSGKTTLLAILGLLDTPTGGSFLLDGKPVQDLTPSERAHVRNRAGDTDSRTLTEPAHGPRRIGADDGEGEAATRLAVGAGMAGHRGIHRSQVLGVEIGVKHRLLHRAGAVTSVFGGPA